VVCFGPDGRFRWQVGDPAELIVLKTPAGCMVAEPKKSIVRHLDAASPAAAAIQELPFPFAPSLDDFHRRFEVASLKNESGKIDLLLTPKDARLAEGLKTLRVNFDAASGAVHLFEMTFRDGSQVATEFTNIEINPKLDDSLFLLKDS
jgi:outer membrane lipoprotein-sorting protein